MLPDLQKEVLYYAFIDLSFNFKDILYSGKGWQGESLACTFTLFEHLAKRFGE